jgi:serine/threonine-protein kinase
MVHCARGAVALPAAMDEADDLTLARVRARVGTTLRDKWRIDALLGTGGMGAVYSATHRNGHRCAIKMLQTCYADSSEVIKRFCKEGYVANRVGHPGVVTVLDDDVAEDGAPFLVMELLEGESFDAVLRRNSGRIDPANLMHIVYEVLDVLVAAHAAGIVHRDIKPENVFLLRDGRIKVLDFGIARVADPRDTTRTQAGAVMGTVGYMPPEQARGRWDEVDAQSDLWSVGAMMFVALAGRPLRIAATPNEELMLAMTEPAPALLSVAASVPLGLADIVDRALAFERRSRWPDARAMQLSVGNLLGKTPAPSPPLAVTQHTAEPEPLQRGRGATVGLLASTRTRSDPQGRARSRNVRWPWMLVGGLAVAVLASSVGVRFWQKHDGARAPGAAPTSTAPVAVMNPDPVGTDTPAAAATLSPTPSSAPGPSDTAPEPSARPASAAPAAARARNKARSASGAPQSTSTPQGRPPADPLSRRL